MCARCSGFANHDSGSSVVTRRAPGKVMIGLDSRVRWKAGRTFSEQEWRGEKSSDIPIQMCMLWID